MTRPDRLQRELLLRSYLYLKHFVETLRPLVSNEEPNLDQIEDLISFKVYDDSQFPLWVTEKLRLGDRTSLTRLDVGSPSIRAHA